MQAPVPATLGRAGTDWEERKGEGSDCQGERCVEGKLKITLHFFHCSIPFLHLNMEEYESN